MKIIFTFQIVWTSPIHIITLLSPYSELVNLTTRLTFWWNYHEGADGSRRFVSNITRISTKKSREN